MLGDRTDPEARWLRKTRRARLKAWEFIQAESLDLRTDRPRDVDLAWILKNAGEIEQEPTKRLAAELLVAWMEHRKKKPRPADGE